MTLPEDVTAGDSGHIADHEEIHAGRVPVLREYTEATLPTADPVGTLGFASDGIRGPRVKRGSGTDWRHLTGKIVDVFRDFGATGDGTTDDTTAIHNARTAAGANGTLVFTTGTYIVSGLTANQTHQRWVLERGATIKLKSSGNAAVITQSAELTLEGGTIDGNKANNTTGHGIAAAGQVLHLRNTRVINASVQGVEQPGSKSEIVGNYFSGHEGSAVRVVSNADDVLIESNTVYDCYNGIFVYDGGTGADCLRTRILNNLVDSMNGTDQGLAQDGGIAVNGCPYTLIANNVVRNSYGRGIHVFGSAHGTSIENNEVIGCGVVAGVSGIDVGDNPTDYNYRIIGNHAEGNGVAGIFASGLKHSVLMGNVCLNNGQYASADAPSRAGIVLNEGGGGGTGSPIEENVIIGNWCQDTQGTKTQEYGIAEWMGTASDYLRNVITGNNVRGNDTAGLLLVSTTNSVWGNVTESGSDGAVLLPSGQKVMFGTDTELRRVGANLLGTDDSFDVNRAVLTGDGSGILYTGAGILVGGSLDFQLHESPFIQMGEAAAPAAPTSNRARIFVQDNGSGKTQLAVRFPTGAVQVIATEP